MLHFYNAFNNAFQYFQSRKDGKYLKMISFLLLYIRNK